MQRKNSECRTTDCSPRSPSGGVIIIWLLVLLSVEGGYYRVRKKRRSEVEKEAPVGAMVGAVLGRVYSDGQISQRLGQSFFRYSPSFQILDQSRDGRFVQ